MLEEFTKRPMMRLLFVWIIGIVLQSYLSFADYIIYLLPLIFLFCLPWLYRKNQRPASYSFRWRWGLLFMLLALLLSVCRTASVERDPLSAFLFPEMEERAADVQQRLLKKLDSLDIDGEEQAVLSTITLGYRKNMDRETKRKFSTTGVAHILSVSGFHVAVVCGFFSCLFYFLPRYRWAEWTRFILMTLLLWSFVFLAGLSASAVRAGLMLTLYSTGRVLEQRPDRYNGWAASAFLMLVYNPHYLFDIGFELSYVAVFFLFWLQPDIKKWLTIRNPLLSLFWDWITVTLAAQAGVTLLCIYYFGQFSTVFLLSAVPVTLMATVLIPLALIWMLMPVNWGDGLAVIVEKLTHWIVVFVDRLSCFPWASVPVSLDEVDLLAMYGVLFSLILAFKKRYSRFLLAALCFLMIGIIF